MSSSLSVLFPDDSSLELSELLSEDSGLLSDLAIAYILVLIFIIGLDVFCLSGITSHQNRGEGVSGSLFPSYELL